MRGMNPHRIRPQNTPSQNDPMRPTALAVGLFTAGLLSAQQIHLTAHPQETLQNGSSHVAPFGVASTGFGGEARVHILVPKNELPGPGAVLTGIELHCLAVGTVNYASLRIAAVATPATVLMTTFAANFAAPPTVVLQATSMPVSWSAAAWVPITFTQPYVHDGASALLLEIKKVVQVAPSYPFIVMTTSSSPPRTDRPSMVCAYGFPGFGASNATVATEAATPVSFRLRWSNVPTLRHRSDLGPSGQQYGLGGTVVLTVQGAAGENWGMATGTGFLTPSVLIPGVGTLRLQGAAVFAFGMLNGVGQATFTIGIPINPGLVGAWLPYQAVTVHPVTFAIALTNGTDHFVNL